jgi:hypothetical protein
VVAAKNIEIVHGSAPGGSNDMHAREIEKALAEAKLIPTSMTVVSKRERAHPGQWLGRQFPLHLRRL